MVVPLHDDQLVLLQVLAAYVPRAAVGVLHSADADALPLSDGVEGQADVLADDAAFGGAHRTGLDRQIPVQERAERSLADEADPGRVALGEVVQPGLLRDPPDVCLLQLA